MRISTVLLPVWWETYRDGGATCQSPWDFPISKFARLAYVTTSVPAYQIQGRNILVTRLGRNGYDKYNRRYAEYLGVSALEGTRFAFFRDAIGLLNQAELPKSQEILLEGYFALEILEGRGKRIFKAPFLKRMIPILT